MSKLTILVTGTNSVGHINACVGITVPLLRRGHRVIFVTDEGFRGKLCPLGFEEYVYTSSKSHNSHSNGSKLANDLFKSNIFAPVSPEVKMQSVVQYLVSDGRLEDLAYQDKGLKEAIALYKPDLIIYDANEVLPVLHFGAIPWIRNVSTAPVYYMLDDELPPGGSGFPTDGDRSKWAEFNQIRRGVLYSSKYNDFVQSLGYDRFPEDIRAPASQILTVYGYPDELNYPSIRNKPNWFNVEVFNKQPILEAGDLSKLLPIEFINDTLDGAWSGKYVFVSMGSLGSNYLPLMKRLVEVLAKTNHKYIVSKGPHHAQIALPGNMFGQQFLPQLELLPHMDLMVTHGGNNSVTETFARGVPMLVMPMFFDQYDNAQRVHETGFGLRLDPFNFEDHQLIDAVDALLHDKPLRDRLQVAAQRIQHSNKHQELADLIEELVQKH